MDPIKTNIEVTLELDSATTLPENELMSQYISRVARVAETVIADVTRSRGSLKCTPESTKTPELNNADVSESDPSLKFAPDNVKTERIGMVGLGWNEWAFEEKTVNANFSSERKE